jgi:hypothetical protein
MSRNQPGIADQVFLCHYHELVKKEGKVCLENKAHMHA